MVLDLRRLNAKHSLVSEKKTWPIWNYESNKTPQDLDRINKIIEQADTKPVGISAQQKKRAQQLENEYLGKHYRQTAMREIAELEEREKTGQKPTPKEVHRVELKILFHLRALNALRRHLRNMALSTDNEETQGELSGSLFAYNQGRTRMEAALQRVQRLKKRLGIK